MTILLYNNTIFLLFACEFPVDFPSDSDSFNPTLWEEQRQQRMQVAFEFEEKKDEEDASGNIKVIAGSTYFMLYMLPETKW